MKFFAFYILLFFTLFAPAVLHAQKVVASPKKIAGTWEGEMSGEFIQINIEQQGNLLCGYTYDYELENRASHCIARFEGMYDPDRNLWYLSGKSFLENSGSHVFMRIILRLIPGDEKNTLTASVYTQSFGNSFSAADVVKIKRVASKPQKLGTVMEPCFPKPQKPAAKSITPKPATQQPDAAKPDAVKPKIPAKQVPPSTPPPQLPKITSKPLPQPARADTVKRTLPPAIKKIPPADKDMVSKMNSRRKTEQSRLEVNVKKINLKVYDNGVVDNDTVSIFYNGKLLLSHKRLSETAIELNIDLDENVTLHEITMYAENLGGIPPNTALIVVTAGGKRYELRSKASLEENAVLVIEYKPAPGG
jgi:hypothetical protein